MNLKNKSKIMSTISPNVRRFMAGSFFLLICASLPTQLCAQGETLSAKEILRRIDRNQNAENRVLTSEMTIHGRRGSRTVKSNSWVEGTDKSFTEYVAPAREKGTKMLKLGDQLWTYSPSTDRTIKISGHLLRQSVMGSDLSYEDLMEDPSMEELYDATIEREEDIEGRACWVLDLTAKDGGVAYAQRKIWVDQERFLPLREHRFGKSGKLLKTTEVHEIDRVGDRWVIRHVTFKDALKKGKGTEFRVEKVEFNTKIPSRIFSKASLRR